VIERKHAESKHSTLNTSQIRLNLVHDSVLETTVRFGTHAVQVGFDICSDPLPVICFKRLIDCFQRKASAARDLHGFRPSHMC